MEDIKSSRRFPIREEDWLGRTAERKIRVTSELLDRFVELSGDSSPHHLSDAGAQRQGFARRVAHGMLLGSLASAVMGVELPGEGSMTQQCRYAFRNPCYVDDEIVIRVTVTECFASVQTLGLKITIERLDGLLLATGEALSGLRPLS